METELIPIADLHPYERNARTHTPEQVAQVAASITEFGWTNPVIIDGSNGIIAGHARLAAAQSIGMIEVPTIRLRDLTEAQKRAYIIADNKLALNAGWDEDLLRIEIGDLLEMEYDLTLTGFAPEELSALMVDDVIEGLTDDDAIPELPDDPVTRLGDVWTLGNHRLMCGDCTNPDYVDGLMAGVYPDLIHTDPPYGMSAVSKSGVLTASYGVDIDGDGSNDTAKEAFNLIHKQYPEAKQIWWGANYYSSVLPDSECWLVWDKNNGQSDQMDCELAWANFRSVVRQFTHSSEKTNRVHPNQKPVALMEWIIKRFNLSSNTIADYFGGSGSTLIAAEKHNIQAFIMESKPAYCDVIVHRWQDYTGKQAYLDEGEHFEAVANARA